MGTMNRMRENTGVVLWVLVISFGGLWVLQDSGVFDTIGTDPLGKVIIVNGDPITRDVYSRQLEAQLEQIRRTNNGNVTPQQLELERERAYNALVENSLRERVMDDIGVTVSDAEVRELILGENPHWLIRQNFSDGAGGINRALLQNVIDDPAQRPTVIQIEQFIRLSRREQRFNQLLEATARASDADAKHAWVLQQKSANAEFFLLQYADVPDSLVSVTDRDVRRYYSDNQEDYARERLYTIQIASLSRLPASEDTLAIMRELERLQQGLEEAENDSLFLAQSGSEIGWSDNFRSASTLAPEIASSLFEQGDVPQTGDVIGPIIVNGQAQLIKVTATRPAEDTHVRARHILLNDKENPAAIRDIRRRIQAGEDFAAVAAQMSDDPGSGSNGGDLGWFGPGRMVAPFEEAAFGASIGTLVGPVETDFGLHLIEVNHRATVDVQLAQLAYTIDVSVATLNSIQEALEDLAYYADEEGDFVGEASRRNIELQVLQVQDGQTAFPGFGQSFAMEAFLRDSDVGEISPVIELDDVALVVQVVDIEEAGYEPFDTVEPQVRQLALLQKKRDHQVTLLRGAYESGGYDGLADGLDITPQIASGVSFQSPIISGLGRDYHFVGIVLGLEAEEDSGVIEGENGTYVVRVTDVFEPVEISDDELNNLKNDLSSEQQTAMLRDWISSLRESAKIEDLRTDLLPLQ